MTHKAVTIRPETLEDMEHELNLMRDRAHRAENPCWREDESTLYGMLVALKVLGIQCEDTGAVDNRYAIR